MQIIIQLFTASVFFLALYSSATFVVNLIVSSIKRETWENANFHSWAVAVLWAVFYTLTIRGSFMPVIQSALIAGLYSLWLTKKTTRSSLTMKSLLTDILKLAYNLSLATLGWLWSKSNKMKKYLHLLWILPVITGSSLWIFGNLLSEIRTFGLFNPEYGVLSGNYPYWFYMASIVSLALIVFTIRFCLKIFTKIK